MSFVKNWVARVAVLVITASTLFALGGPIGTASASSLGCNDGDRGLAASIASSGAFKEPGTATTSDAVRITLRYAPKYNCAWGLLNAEPRYIGLGNVWIDRSSNSGSGWAGPLGTVRTAWNQTSTYTGTWNVNGYDSVRACGNSIVSGRVSNTVCTPWYFPGRLGAGHMLGVGEYLTSPSGRNTLIMQTDGNLVAYVPGRPVWASGTNIAGTVLWMQNDGNLVLVAPGNRPIWATGTSGSGAYLQMQNDANVVVYRNGVPRWASNTAGR
ncbi:hypothetical protein [Streptomyces sp. NPDC060333]|uniref:hypothetical protein n=1 Tax=Streptomyces sp. NPDC060333 TaxID=3347098 RepID=UPI00366559D5